MEGDNSVLLFVHFRFKLLVIITLFMFIDPKTNMVYFLVTKISLEDYILYGACYYLFLIHLDAKNVGFSIY